MEFTFSHNPGLLGVSRIADYVGVWAIKEDAFKCLVEGLGRTDLAAHVAAYEPTAPEAYQLTSEGVAVIQLRGVMSKAGNSLSDSGSTIIARQNIRQAVADESVNSIVMVIESPGGTAAGTQELAEEVERAKKKKPMIAYVEDVGASAAYWVASQATEVYANASAVVGSIGTYMAVSDYSKAAESKGVKVHVVRAGEYKGAGYPGTEITDEQLANWQSLVDKVNQFFTDAVSRGRGMNQTQVNALADGRVHIAGDALTLGLIDGVATYDEVLDAASSVVKPQGEPKMSESTNTPATPTLQELERAFPKSSSDWKLDQLRQGATMDEARAAWQAHLESKIAESQEQVQKAQDELEARDKKHAEELEQAKKQMPGNPPLAAFAASQEPDGVADIITQFKREVDVEAEKLAKMYPAERPMSLRFRASTKVRERHPEWLETLDAGVPLEK